MRGRLQHKPMQSAQHTPVAPAEGALAAREAAAQTCSCCGISDAGAGAEMLELALRNPITGVPRAREAAAQTHSCGGISTAVKLALRKPITGVPRAREAAAQTHSCGGISRRRNAKTGPPQSNHGSAARAGGCSTNS